MAELRLYDAAEGGAYARDAEPCIFAPSFFAALVGAPMRVRAAERQRGSSRGALTEFSRARWSDPLPRHPLVLATREGPVPFA
jgi:hypothetical protein